MSQQMLRFPCPTCTGPNRETVGMVCQTCGRDYGSSGDTCFELDGARVHGDPNMPSEARDALRTLIAAATQHMHDQRRDEIQRLATILANTRPEQDVEGEWAIRLWDAGVRPPKRRPRVARTPAPPSSRAVTEDGE